MVKPCGQALGITSFERSCSWFGVAAIAEIGLDERPELGERAEALGVELDRAVAPADAEVGQQASVIIRRVRPSNSFGVSSGSGCSTASRPSFTSDSTVRAIVSLASGPQTARACSAIVSASSTPNTQRSTPLNSDRNSASPGAERPMSYAFANAPSWLLKATASRPRLARSHSGPER